MIISCSEDETVNYTKTNEEEILKYIDDHNLDAQKSSTGLYYVIDKLGEGAQPNVNSNVTVKYKGYFSNGEVFDQSDSNGITFNLQQVIAGWTEGITYFKEEGKGILLIPSRLGYGDNDRGSIPGGSVLIFDIELLDVK
ncbi:MAG: FKBP-type peptidyl-prolyl cis-trans isomerase [Bacteroidota bacterium]